MAADVPEGREARVEYDEFSFFHENADEFNLPFAGPPVVRRESVQVAPGRSVSALVWGEAPPEVVLIHGGAQNAHTWDTVALALDRPLVAIDLPGHGHADAAGPIVEGQPRTVSLAADVAVAIRTWAPAAKLIVGMSLGGLTSISLAATEPDLVRSLLLVDITPGVDGKKAEHIVKFVDGPKTFPSFQELLDRTMEFNPSRSESSLRRGILHNALQLDDGSWIWRYRRHDSPETIPGEGAVSADADAGPLPRPDFEVLWEQLGAIDVPVLLARGMAEQSVVDDADVAAFLVQQPQGRVVEFPEAGHSIQGDSPVELADLIGSVVAEPN